ncbi:hypothetical protein [Bifidobacterium vespertilionis]|uniref:CTP synthase n=1 Tax=Bifidobacterium vespertilionis TaxID=2562524 RepID=A0A5J5E5K5_9BIFI|nr:hypothetical protein [Bifidobacterium vespertilionis]KAA8821370.1 hypothetical protein EMO90_04230 [Bifidobacterium vespertilionis]KAA8824315.1 hypothetical protein EM848_02250 [Bifidobacterium vespertilionis]
MKANERLTTAITNAENSGMCLWTRDPNGLRSIRARVKAGELIAVRDDLFARPSYWSGLPYIEQIMHILRAVIAKHRKWVLGGLSAAAVWGLNETYRMHDHVYLATDLRSHCRNRRYFKFLLVPSLEPEMRNGLPVTGLLQTVFDCARTLPFDQALAICDAAMRIHGLARSAMETFVANHRGFKGVSLARKVFAHADPRSENGGESIVRALLIQWGYAVPLMQQWITDPVTGRRWRVDFLWILPDGRMIVLELDGREKYVNPVMTDGRDVTDVILAEKERESGIQLRGDIRFVRTTFKQATEQSEALRFKLDLAGVPKC